MKASESVALLAALKAAYPRQTIPDATVKVYARMLEDVGHEEAQCAVRTWVARSPYFPTIAELRNAVAEDACALASPEAAWGEVTEALLRFDPNDSDTWWPEWSSPEVGRAVRSMGGLNCLHDSRSVSTDRAHFFRIFAELRRATVDAANVGALALGSGSSRRELPSG